MAASRTPFRVHCQRARRQARSSGLPCGISGSARKRALNANAPKARNNKPEENFESKAPARHSPKRAAFLRVGSCHRSANRHRVSKQNKVTAKSVRTKGPKTMKVGVLM